MKIGITERGDASINLSWKDRLPTVDGVILITKNLTPTFIDSVNEARKQGHKLIVHATCTGWGGTELEPNVPKYQAQLTTLRTLILSGFPKEQCVLRIDPIFPTANGLGRIGQVLGYADKLGLLPIRVRISIYDEYKHVRERLQQHGINPMYGGSFYAPYNMMEAAKRTLQHLANKYGITFETCAEPKLACNEIQPSGCISAKDLSLMGLELDPTLTQNPQNRTGCMCLSCKTELLENRCRCPHQCLYCFWKD